MQLHDILRSVGRGITGPDRSGALAGVAGAPERADVLRALWDATTEVLGLPEKTLAHRTCLFIELDVDLLMDIALVIEEAHGTAFTEAELVRMTCLNDIAECLTRRFAIEH